MEGLWYYNQSGVIIGILIMVGSVLSQLKL